MKKQITQSVSLLSCLLFAAPSASAAGSFWREASAGVPGAVSVTSTEEGKTTFECIGMSDSRTQVKMSPDAVFQMPSNAMGLVAATVLSVVGEGGILLDDPVEKLLPAWKNPAAVKHPTLRMFLSQTAGAESKGRNGGWETDAAIAMVEKATGRPFGVEMRERLFRPLGMDATSFGGFQGRGGGIESTPRDMVKFFRMIAEGGRAPDGTVVVTEGLMKAWLANQAPEGSGSRRSFGMRITRKGTLAYGGASGSFGEADTVKRRVRLLMVGGEGKTADAVAFRRNWMGVTDLQSKWFWYSSEYLGLDRTPSERNALTNELWRHDAAAETKIWPKGKVPFRKDDKPLRFLTHEIWQRNLVVTDINDPFFVFYPAGKKVATSGEGEEGKPVVVVLPGGGYSVLGWNKEGTEIAAWLNANGLSAAVLLYRAPDQRKAALCDVQRTIGLLRRDAAKYGIDPKKVGVIGFSAGANLAVTVSTNWRKRAYDRVDDADDFPCRPDFQLPIYLWDVLERDGNPEDIAPLLENGREPKLRAEYPVDAQTPPAFLAQAKDDFCQVETTVFFHRALKSAGVKGCEMHLMDCGGHGYGLRRVGNPTDGWSDLAILWIKRLLANDECIGTNVRTFGKTKTGEAAHLYTLTRGEGLTLEVSDFGGRLVRCLAPGRDGKVADVTLGWNTVGEYEELGFSMGTLIGRYGNRIRDGRFTLEGKTYQLPINETKPAPRHCNCHSGPDGWDAKVWKVESASGDRLVLSLVSPDGDVGFPGTVKAKATYEVLPGNVWRISYEATTDKPTVLNMTHHSYWNLAGEASGNVLGQLLRINADRYTQTDAGLIPTKDASVEGTGMDFRALRPIGAKADLMKAEKAFAPMDNWYDHNFVLNGKVGEMKFAAEMRDPVSGRKLEIWTTEPCMQMYGAQNMTDALPAKAKGRKLCTFAGMALETQHYPDSPNHPEFPSTVLRPGETFRSVTEYRFGTFDGTSRL